MYFPYYGPNIIEVLELVNMELTFGFKNTGRTGTNSRKKKVTFNVLKKNIKNHGIMSRVWS